jgi:hypothetical protein
MKETRKRFCKRSHCRFKNQRKILFEVNQNNNQKNKNLSRKKRKKNKKSHQKLNQY